MNDLADKIYVHAKINALHGFLLSKENYLEITRSGKIHTAFPGILSEKDSSDVVQTKDIIFKNQIKIFILFICLNDYYSDFFKAFLLLFELTNIKQVVSKAYGRKQLFPQWNNVSPYGTMDASIKDKDISLDDLPSLFAGTIFSEALLFGDSPSYEELERKIDFLAIQNLMRCSRNLHPADRNIFLDTMTRKIIHLKIAWGNRCEKHHESDFQQFDPKELLEESGVADEMIESIEKETRKKITAEFAVPEAHPDINSTTLLERFLNHLFMSHVKKIFSKDFHSICPVISYSWSLYYQILNLFTIIEGIHLKVNPDTIMQHIITGA